MADAALAPDGNAARLAYRLAAVVARPLDVVDPDVGGLDPLSAATTRAIAANPHFRRPINRAVAQSLGLFDLAIDGEQIAAIAASERSRMAAALVADDLARVYEAALELAAVIVHKRALAFTLKADRERVRTAFGDEPYRIATREAPMLYASLTELDLGKADVEAVASGAEGAPTFAKQLASRGLEALSAFVRREAPVLSPLFALRCPAQVDTVNRDRLAQLLGDAHCDHIVKLNRRRFAPWLAPIG
jgi:hypothetical protein